MFKHILLPTDGTAQSDKALTKGLELAKMLGAKVTAVHVEPEFPIVYYSDWAPLDPSLEQQFKEESKKRAEGILGKATQAAQAAGVACATVYLTSYHTYEGIIRTAEERGCDLILMASHGRRGLESLLLGSETRKVLTHSKVPVLVYR